MRRTFPFRFRWQMWICVNNSSSLVYMQISLINVNFIPVYNVKKSQAMSLSLFSKSLDSPKPIVSRDVVVVVYYTKSNSTCFNKRLLNIRFTWEFGSTNIIGWLTEKYWRRFWTETIVNGRIMIFLCNDRRINYY